MPFNISVRDWLLAKDPGFSRLRLGSRIVLTILLSVAAIAAFWFAVAPLPAAAVGLGITLAIQGGLTVRDATLSEQFVTRLIGSVVSVMIVGLAALLETYRLVSDVAFLVVIFAAAYGRGFGQRWNAVGMFAFMSYFMGAYLKPPLEQLPLIAVGALAPLLAAHIVRAFILPDDPRADLLRALASVRQRTDFILRELAILDGEPPKTASERRQLRRLEDHMREAVLMTEGLVPRTAEGELPDPDSSAGRLSIALYDLHLAIESVIVLSQQAPPPRALLLALAVGRHAVARQAVDPQQDDVRQESLRALEWLEEARRTLDREISAVSQTTFPAVPSVAPGATAQPPKFSFGNPAFRTAVQVTLASGIAMIFGLMLSRDRWFWAVLTAFLVFINTRSRGDTAMKAVQRSLGTLLGIGVGLALAALLAGNTAALVILAVIGIFLAFYSLMASYAAMTFFISVVISLIYSLMGVITFDLMRLRLEETLIGAVVGAAVAFFVFPTRTGATLDTALDKWFDALDHLLGGVREGAGGLALIARSQALDRAYSELSEAARPLGVSWQVVRRPGHVRQTLAIFMAVTYWGRMLARGTSTANELDEETRAYLYEATNRLSEVRRRKSECFYIARKSSPAKRTHLPISRKGQRLGLEMIAAILARLYP
ncbi:MAG: FUSC family protein [Shinella sp.]|nr:FUSC family protein [Shinella sp.]